MKALLVTFFLIFAATCLAQTPKAALKLGDKAPDFELLNGDSKPVALSSYTARGPVVVVFYRGFW